MKSRLADLRASLSLAWPIMVTQVAQSGSSFVDATMAGHYSSLDLAAISVGGSVWVAILVVLFGLTLAVNPLVSHRVGAQDLSAIPSVVRQAIWQNLFFAAIGIVAAWLISPIFGFIGLDPVSAGKASQFLRAVVWGLPAIAIHRTLAGYSSGLGKTRPMMFIALFGLILNIPANWLLIYGRWGFPELGGVGCGYATAFCLWVSAILMLLWTYWAPAYRSTQPLTHWERIDWSLQSKLFRLGLPIGIAFLVEVSAFGLVTFVIAPFGANQLAAHQIALSFGSLVFMIPAGLGHALTVRVGHAIGARKPHEAQFIGQTGIYMGLVYAIFSALLIAFMKGPIAGLYTNDPQVHALAVQLLIYAAVFQLADATQVILAGILRGYNITRFPMGINICAFWVIGIPLGYTLAHSVSPGATGIWQSLVLALMIVSVLLFWLFRRESHRHLSRV